MVKKRYMTWDEIGVMVNQLAMMVDKDKYNSIYGIPRGGLVPAVMLSHIIDKPVVPIDLISEKTLIIDDICDTGVTMKCFLSKGQKNTATLIRRSTSKIIPDYHAKTIYDHDYIVFPWEVN